MSETPLPPPPPPPPPAGTGGPPPTSRRGGRGCLIAALIVIALLVTGSYVGYLMVRDRVDEALEDGGIGNLGECTRFQTSLMFMTMSNLMTMGSDQLNDQLGEIRSIAPAAVRDDIDVIASALGEAMGEGLVGAAAPGGGTQTPEQQAAAEAEVEAILESPEVQQASDNINAWAAENCGDEVPTGGFFPRSPDLVMPARAAPLPRR